MSNTTNDLEKEAKLRQQADEMLYASIRRSGVSHEEAVKRMYEIKLSAEREQRKVIQEIQEEERLAYMNACPPEPPIETTESVDISSLKSYYGSKAFKHLILFLLLAIPIYLIATYKTDISALTLESLLSATGVASIFAIIILVLLLGVYLFNNILIGPIVAILVFGFLGNKANELQDKYNISDTAIEHGLIFIGASYLVTNLFLFIRNIIKYFKP